MLYGVHNNLSDGERVANKITTDESRKCAKLCFVSTAIEYFLYEHYAGIENTFEDSDFIEINETRILNPDEK